ncbi:RHS repeat domain-containing protein [Flavobacterium branchiophilum]|uniref:RHS repeat domain-containing protein n=1 Tax=Flavobacterium branchiophilum TaxID=55197 RepID=UPI0021AB0DBE|nr:RHS repeat-associated core domain-containing protein [Flavobacterium branchiophilum]
MTKVFFDNNQFLNRLLEAVYQKPEQPNPIRNSYNERLLYDKNGNIMRLLRNGEYDDAVNVLEIDRLDYTYNYNQLMGVADSTNNPNGFKDSNTEGDDYRYDLNGNMTMDLNKNITSITYNHLNLPTKILFGEMNSILYFYTASGQKVNKVVNEAGVITTTDYINGFQYKTLPSGDGGLVFFPHAEGYVNVNESYKLTESSLFNYVFNYTDHLGNIRMSYTQTPTGALSILEENHYYPFGLKHTNYNSDKRLYVRESVSSKIKPVTPLFPLVYNYKYNGKEWQDELGLNVTAMDFRQYDSAIGRFYGMDTLTELYPDFSPYRFGFNNPNYWSDPTGLLENNLAYPSGNGTTPGQVHKDDDGHWIWNGSLWVGQNGTPDMLAEVVVSASSSSSSNSSNYLISQWWNARNLAFDANVRMKYYFPKNEYIFKNSSNAAEYAFSRYHIQQSTRAQLSPQGKAISEILKSKKAQLETAKYYALNKINPSGNLRGGLSSAKLLRGTGTSVVVISAGMSIYNVATAENTTQALSTEIGGWTGAYAGAKAGAAFGTLFSPWGTVIGGVVGGAVGYWGGTEAGSAIYNSTQD